MKYHQKTEVERRYWTIGDASKDLNVPESTIRYWLKTFGIDQVIKRNGHGDRILKGEDIELLRVIERLLKAELYTIAGVKLKLSDLLYRYKKDRITVDESEVSNMLRVGCLVLCLLFVGCRPYFNQANVVKVEKGKHSTIGR